VPKLRDPVDSLRDAQRHLSVFRSRSLKSDNGHNMPNISTEINEAITIIDRIINKLPQEPKSSSDKIISSELDLINKEVKKNVEKIDYRAAVRAMCNSDSIANAKNIGLEYNIPADQVNQVINKASVDTPLGKAVAAYKAKAQKLKPKPIVVEPPADIEEEEQQNTIDSDYELDEQLKKQLGQGE
jgi:hypothetical protein